MSTPVAELQQRSSLTRTMRVGDELSIDNSRIVIRVENVDRKRGTIRFLIDRDLLVDKPAKPKPA